MKLFQQMLVATASLGLIAPIAAQASDIINLEGMNDYSRSIKSSSKRFDNNTFVNQVNEELAGLKSRIDGLEAQQKNFESGYFIDQIRSEACHKGTGNLTVETSLNYGFPLPSIYEAFNARVESNFQNWWQDKLEEKEIDINIEFLRNTIYFARLATMVQGMLFIEHILSLIHI